jgi:hypothetical protein
MDKDKKGILSVQLDKELFPLLRKICATEKRSQAKQIEYWILREAKNLNISDKSDQ